MHLGKNPFAEILPSKLVCRRVQDRRREKERGTEDTFQSILKIFKAGSHETD